jgi:hypothetical protein
MIGKAYLSPQNKSISYNAEKFAQEKSAKNFTEEELKD